ncbi:MAG: hypothetical protein ACYCOU_16430 [Sulfobacillus sp.]
MDAEKIPFEPQPLKQVLCVYMTGDRLLAVAEDVGRTFYAIKNRRQELEEREERTSEVFFSRDLSRVLTCFSASEKQLLGCRRISLSGEDRLALSGTVGIDVVEYPGNLGSYLSRNGASGTTHFDFPLTSEVLREFAGKCFSHMVLCQQALVDLQFIGTCQIRSLSLDACPALNNDAFRALIPTEVSSVIVRAPCSPELDFRVLESLLRMPRLESLSIEVPDLSCQQNPYFTLIKKEDWPESPSLKQLCITSEKLTLDCIAEVLNACPELERLVLADEVYQKAKDNCRSGTDTARLVIQGTGGRGTSFFKDVVVRNLLRQQYHQEPFSESMKEVIKRQGGTVD